MEASSLGSTDLEVNAVRVVAALDEMSLDFDLNEHCPIAAALLSALADTLEDHLDGLVGALQRGKANATMDTEFALAVSHAVRQVISDYCDGVEHEIIDEVGDDE